MGKPSTWPQTRVSNPMPERGTEDWVIWAAWADRITFEEIEAVTGLTESEVIKLMRRSLKRSSFKRWRERATSQSIKHRKRFAQRRAALTEWSFDEE